MTLNVDLGQIIITGAIATFGWVIRNQVQRFETRLDKHDTMLIRLIGDTQKLIGFYEAMKERNDG